MNDVIRRDGVGPRIAERVKQLAGGPRPKVQLPGFHIFQADPSPFRWAVPKPKDPDSVIAIWEAYASALAGEGDMTPYKALRYEPEIIGKVVATKMFGQGGKRPGDWFIPAAKLIAMAQHGDEGQAEMRVEIELKPALQDSLVSLIEMRQGTYMMQVSPRGIFYNVGKRYVRPPHGGHAPFRLDRLCIRPLVTSNPIAVAMAECDELDVEALYAANVALRGEMMGELPRGATQVTTVVGERTPRRRKAAIESALARLAAGGIPPTRGELCEILVPAALGSVEFRSLFGNGSAPMGHRESTVTSWRQRVLGLLP